MTSFNIRDHDLRDLTGKLENSYFAFNRLHHIDSTCLPSQSAIHELLRQLLAMLYPGFFGRQDLTAGNIQAHIRQQLEQMAVNLHEQIVHCLDCRRGNRNDDTAQRGTEITMQFLRRLPEIREVLAADVLSAYKGDPAAADTNEVIFSYPATLAISTYRLAHALLELEVPLMPRILTEHAHSLTGIDIHPGTTIGKGFFIDHGTGVVIGETAVLGENCKLYQGVTLGALSFPHDDRGQIIRGQKRHPTLEDEVIVYANATILGDITIGKSATIGGNIFVTNSVPPGSTVTAKKAELKYRNRPNDLNRGKNDAYDI